MEWQPIETAPKDGTEVLTWRRASLMAVASWWPAIKNAKDGTWRDTKGGTWCVTDGNDIIEVTHWMPLPAPPIATPSTAPRLPRHTPQT